MEGEVGLEFTESPSKPTLAAPGRNSWSLGAIFHLNGMLLLNLMRLTAARAHPIQLKFKWIKAMVRVQCYRCQDIIPSHGRTSFREERKSYINGGLQVRQEFVHA